MARFRFNPLGGCVVLRYGGSRGECIPVAALACDNLDGGPGVAMAAVMGWRLARDVTQTLPLLI